MHRFIISVGIFAFLLIGFGNALACRGPILSISELIQRSESIFTATVIAPVPSESGEETLELRVTDVLQGSVPQTVLARGSRLIHPNDRCLAVEAGVSPPRVAAGEKWLISGKLSSTREFAPISGGNFRLVGSNGKPVEGMDQWLMTLRREIRRASKQPTASK